MTFKELLEIGRNGLSGLSSLKNPDFRLEQAEYINDKNEWEIVLSYLVPNTNKRNSAIAAITSEFEFLRLYKRLRINSEGNIIGFYIYENEK